MNLLCLKSIIDILLPEIKTTIFCARSDSKFISLTLPKLCTTSQKVTRDISVILDTRNPSGVLASILNQKELGEIIEVLKSIQRAVSFKLLQKPLDPLLLSEINRKALGYHYKESHCFRGYPIYGSFQQFLDTDAKYILHFDCDMIFYEEPNFSWINEGVRVMEENEDILCVLPRGGPPTKDGLLRQGTTNYKIDEKRGLYLFKNFTSRHYLIHRERFLSLLPLKPQWLSWREPIKSRFFGNGKMLCWENMVERALTKSHMWRADLMTDRAWSLHPGDRSEEFYQLLPQIIDSVTRNEFPEKQRGHFDLMLSDWKHFLN